MTYELQAVVVIYKLEIGASKTIASLYSLGRQPGLEISLLIYDKSPSPRLATTRSRTYFQVLTFTTHQNGGLAPAYNLGVSRWLKITEPSGCCYWIKIPS